MEEVGQFEQGLTRMAWKPAQMEYVRKLFSEMLPGFQSRSARLRFTVLPTAPSAAPSNQVLSGPAKARSLKSCSPATIR
jgi:hypothetical protein